MKNRDEIITQLTEQYNNEYANNGYKSEFKPDGSLTECNFGGLLIIINNSCDGCLVWSDWSDNAISEQLTECEIEYFENEDNDNEMEAGFVFNNNTYFLSEFMCSNF